MEKTYARFFVTAALGKQALSRSRKRRDVMARRLAAKFLRGAGMTLQEVARVLDIHHSSVIYLLKDVHDPEYRRFEAKNAGRMADVYEALEEILKFKKPNI